MKKWLPYLILGLMLVLVVVLRKCNADNAPTPSASAPARKSSSPSKSSASTESSASPGKINRDRGFDRRVSYIEYTDHAKCRMQCRKVTQEEVKDIMQNGKINYKKSDVKDFPCPTYAIEGYSSQDNQHLRIVFAQCDTKTKVVTCIDLDKDFECDCK